MHRGCLPPSRWRGTTRSRACWDRCNVAEKRSGAQRQAGVGAAIRGRRRRDRPAHPGVLAEVPGRLRDGRAEDSRRPGGFRTRSSGVRRERAPVRKKSGTPSAATVVTGGYDTPTIRLRCRTYLCGSPYLLHNRRVVRLAWFAGVRRWLSDSAQCMNSRSCPLILSSVGLRR